MRRGRGFTLIELVIVMLVISFGLVGLTALFSNSATSLTTNETLQQATQYAQGCAESAIATRRDNGFNSLNGFSCGATNPGGFTRSVPVNTIVSGTGIGTDPCPTGVSNCRKIRIDVASTANASLSSSITLMLVN